MKCFVRINLVLCLPFLCCVLGLACGQLEDMNYQGESLLQLHGTISVAEGTNPPENALHVGLLWLFRKAGVGFNVQMLESITQSQFPSKFNLDLFSDPPDSALMAHEDVGGYFEMLKQYDILEVFKDVKLEEVFPKASQLGAGIVVIWEDTNNNGKFDFDWNFPEDVQIEDCHSNCFAVELQLYGGPDRIVGGAPNNGIAFVKGEAFPPKFVEVGIEAQRYGEIGIKFKHGDQLEPGYYIFKTTGKDANIPYQYTDQFEMAPQDSDVDLVLSPDKLWEAIPDCCGPDEWDDY